MRSPSLYWGLRRPAWWPTNSLSNYMQANIAYFSGPLLRSKLLDPHVGGLSSSWNTSMKLSAIYYRPRGYWKGLTAIKKLTSAAKETEQQAKDWLKKQAIWQIYLPDQRHIPRPKLDVAISNEVNQADLLFLPRDRVRRKTFRYALTVVDVASRYKEAEPLISKTALRSPMALPEFTSRAPCGGRSSLRLTSAVSSWAPSVSCWRSSQSRFGAVGLTFTGTKAS